MVLGYLGVVISVAMGAFGLIWGMKRSEAKDYSGLRGISDWAPVLYLLFCAILLFLSGIFVTIEMWNIKG